jgi:hypothetical protein
MKRTLFAAGLAAGLAALPAAPARADRADDDLAAVRKAVGATRAEDARPTPAPPAEKSSRPSRSLEGKWLRVRVTERAGKHAKVSINVPLGLARAFGEDWRIRDCSSCQHGRGPTLGDVLRAFESGQSLFEIDDDEASVRVWVD